MRKLLFIFIFVSTNTFADEFATYLKCEPIEKKVVPIFRESNSNCGPICTKQKQNLKLVGRAKDRSLSEYRDDDQLRYLAPQNETVNFNTCGFHDNDEEGELTIQNIAWFDSDSLDLKRGAHCPSSKRMNTYSISDLLENKIKVNWKKLENDILQLNLKHEEKKFGHGDDYDLPIPKDVDFLIIKLSKTGRGFYWGASLKEKNPYSRDISGYRESFLGISKDFLADPDWEFPYSNKLDSYCSNQDMHYVDKNLFYKCVEQILADSPLTIDRKTLIYKRQFWKSRTEFYQCVLSDKDTNTRIFKAYSEIEGKMSDIRIDDRAKKKKEREELEELKERSEPNKI